TAFFYTRPVIGCLMGSELQIITKPVSVSRSVHVVKPCCAWSKGSLHWPQSIFYWELVGCGMTVRTVSWDVFYNGRKTMSYWKWPTTDVVIPRQWKMQHGLSWRF